MNSVSEIPNVTSPSRTSLSHDEIRAVYALVEDAVIDLRLRAYVKKVSVRGVVNSVIRVRP